jgi:guanylate kinase
MTSIEQAITDYRPTDEAIELVRSTKISLLVGIAGVGKDTIKRELLKDSYFRDIVSHTTRPPRINNGVAETDGIDYHFIDDLMAKAMIDEHKFIEVKFVHGTIYGTSLEEIQLTHSLNKVGITDIDVQGVAEYKALCPDVIALFLLPPDYTTWLERLTKRYESPKAFAAEWGKRRQSAIRELTHALEVPYYHFIINDKIEKTVAVAREFTSHTIDTFQRKDDEVRLRARDLLEAIQSNP